MEPNRIGGGGLLYSWCHRKGHNTMDIESLQDECVARSWRSTSQEQKMWTGDTYLYLGSACVRACARVFMCLCECLCECLLGRAHYTP